MFDESMAFRDRREAGRRLGDYLAQQEGENALVLGLARGGMVVADEVARRLNAELDVMVVRKLGAPYSEELAIGAVTANGGIYINENAVRLTGADREHLEREISKQRETARVREARYRQHDAAPTLEKRQVILVDDGLATGASMIAAARSARSRQPATLIIAVPVGAPESCREISGEADEVVCLLQPAYFDAVGMFYQDFSEVDDTEVEQVLASARLRTLQRGSAR